MLELLLHCRIDILNTFKCSLTFFDSYKHLIILFHLRYFQIPLFGNGLQLPPQATNDAAFSSPIVPPSLLSQMASLTRHGSSDPNTVADGALPTNDPTATNEIADAQPQNQDNGEWTAIHNLVFSYKRQFSYFQHS